MSLLNKQALTIESLGDFLARPFYSLRWRMRSGKKIIGTRYPSRRDIVRFELESDVGFEVFWKVLPIGKGPAVSLFVFGEEILKFDCFGMGDGHYHIEPEHERGRTIRFYFAERAVEAQIERTVFELKNNLNCNLSLARNPLVRRLHVDQEKLNAAVEQVRTRMLEYYRSVPELMA